MYTFLRFYFTQLFCLDHASLFYDRARGSVYSRKHTQIYTFSSSPTAQVLYIIHVAVNMRLIYRYPRYVYSV